MTHESVSYCQLALCVTYVIGVCRKPLDDSVSVFQ